MLKVDSLIGFLPKPNNQYISPTVLIYSRPLFLFVSVTMHVSFVSHDEVMAELKSWMTTVVTSSSCRISTYKHSWLKKRQGKRKATLALPRFSYPARYQGVLSHESLRETINTTFVASTEMACQKANLSQKRSLFSFSTLHPHGLFVDFTIQLFDRLIQDLILLEIISFCRSHSVLVIVTPLIRSP